MVIRQVVNTVFNSCSYVISHDGTSWLVDCGDIDKLLPLVDGRLSGVMLTHAHFDHIYGLNHLEALFPGVPVLTNAAGREALLSDKLNFSRYHEEPFILDMPEVIKVVPDGTDVKLFDGIHAQAIYTPGHSPDCVTWRVGMALFTGDSYIPGVKIVTNFPHSDKDLALRSRDRILDLAEGCQLYPGHPAHEDVEI